MYVKKKKKPRVAPRSPLTVPASTFQRLVAAVGKLRSPATAGHAKARKMEKPGKSKTKVRKSRSRGMRTKTGW